AQHDLHDHTELVMMKVGVSKRAHGRGELGGTHGQAELGMLKDELS
ncbi:hypothetical protein A2U01_0083238, partial [Trifolium medium]|nr:hypothetical protein [Trifolium medium]